MEEKNILLRKEYHLDAEMLRKGVKAYQGKYVYSGAWIKTAIFAVLAANFIDGAVKDSTNVMAYILIVLCLAMMGINIFNPLRQRRYIVNGFLELGDETFYCLNVYEDEIEIETIGTESENSVYPRNDSLKVLEKEDFFLIIYAKEVYYIIPKDVFDLTELEIIRKI